MLLQFTGGGGGGGGGWSASCCCCRPIFRYNAAPVLSVNGGGVRDPDVEHMEGTQMFRS